MTTGGTLLKGLRIRKAENRGSREIDGPSTHQSALLTYSAVAGVSRHNPISISNRFFNLALEHHHLI